MDILRIDFKRVENGIKAGNGNIKSEGSESELSESQGSHHFEHHNDDHNDADGDEDEPLLQLDMTTSKLPKVKCR